MCTAEHYLQTPGTFMHTRREEILLALQESYFTLVDVNEFKVPSPLVMCR